MYSYRIIKPSSILSNYISHYWALRMDSAVPGIIRSVPSGCIGMYFHRGEKIWLPAEKQYQPRSFVCGISTCFHDLQALGPVDMIVVVFRPYGARAFFSEPLNCFYNRMVSLDDLHSQQLNNLTENIKNTEDTDECIRHIEKYLLWKMQSFDEIIFKRMKVVIHSIDSNDAVTASAMSALACLSNRQFNRVFANSVGTGTKEFTRIVRFQRALFGLQKKKYRNLTETALWAGYYDHSHMVREFKILTGYTPTEYLALGEPFSDYFSCR